MGQTNALSNVTLKSVIKNFGILFVFFALVIVLSIISPNHAFAQPYNIINILKQTAINGILATGMLFVIVSGGIDLSIGSIVGVTAVLSAMLAHTGGYPLIVAIVIPILVGAVFGLVNGALVSYGGIPPFIVTLGSMTVLRGLALIISGGSPITGVSMQFEKISSSFVFGIPSLAIYFALVVLICAIILQKTVFGRNVFAIGGNEISARVSGVNVNFIRLLVYGIMGLLAGFCGVLMASRTTTGAPLAGSGYEMDAIAAAVIGGVSMTGGVGKWYGVVIGALLIAVIGNGLDILGVASSYQQVIKGLIIIVAVFLDLRGKRNKK
ncbi:MAG: ABC transporter permease [Clostridiales Family XIII bacterium]|jgi:ribose/xylose/arabinose/galactoside ABC-type transport system permease subunit|nr:ABC transporter permease [Clostridiales Family XIII bacterium]